MPTEVEGRDPSAGRSPGGATWHCKSSHVAALSFRLPPPGPHEAERRSRERASFQISSHGSRSSQPLKGGLA